VTLEIKTYPKNL